MKKYVKLFEEYNEEKQNGSMQHPGFLQSNGEILNWLEDTDNNYPMTSRYMIHDDWSVDVEGDVDFDGKNLSFIVVQYNKVNGDFNCGGPTNMLESLKGSPTRVSGDFWCDYSNLVTLEYAPDHIGGDFNCEDNDGLVTFGHKSIVEGEFECSELQGSVEERVQRYIDYLNGLKREDQINSLLWLYDVDEEFKNNVIEYIQNNDVKLSSGIDVSLINDASKHKDSGLF